MRCGRKKKDGKICKRVITQKGTACPSHRRKKSSKRSPNNPYGKGSGLLSVYRTSIRPKSPIAKYMKAVESEIKEKGKTFSESLDEEVTLMRALVMDSLGMYGELETAHQKSKSGGNAKEILETFMIRFNTQDRIVSQLDRIGRTMEKNHIIKYGEQQSIKIEMVKGAFRMLQEIIIRNVKEPEVLRKILGDMHRTMDIEPIKTVGEKSGNG